jgi:hypothetical protein
LSKRAARTRWWMRFVSGPTAKALRSMADIKDLGRARVPFERRPKMVTSVSASGASGGTAAIQAQSLLRQWSSQNQHALRYGEDIGYGPGNTAADFRAGAFATRRGSVHFANCFETGDHASGRSELSGATSSSREVIEIAISRTLRQADD